MTLSEYLKELGLKSYSDPMVLDAITTKATLASGPAFQPVSMVGSLSTPSEQIGDTMSQYVTAKDSFQKKFGTEEELLPHGAMHQFAEQQVNPEHFRRTVRDMSGLDRHLSSSGAWRTGHGQAERGRALDEAERGRRGDIAAYMDQQKNLFTDWYGQEMYSYMTSKDPSNYGLSAAGLGDGYGDLGWTNTPGARPQQMQYNPLDMRDYFRQQGRGGFQPQPGNLYGTLHPQGQPQATNYGTSPLDPVTKDHTQPWTPEPDGYYQQGGAYDDPSKWDQNTGAWVGG